MLEDQCIKYTGSICKSIFFFSYVNITIRQVQAVLQVFLLKEQQLYEAA